MNLLSPTQHCTGLARKSRGEVSFYVGSCMDAITQICEAAAIKDGDALRDAIPGVNQDFAAAPLLAHLLLEGWHESHEDIVFELGLIGNPCAIEAIAKVAAIHWAYLVQQSMLGEFQRKCTYALARLGTDESKAALVQLCNSSDSVLSRVAEEGLQQWPLPY